VPPVALPADWPIAIEQGDATESGEAMTCSWGLRSRVVGSPRPLSRWTGRRTDICRGCAADDVALGVVDGIDAAAEPAIRVAVAQAEQVAISCVTISSASS